MLSATLLERAALRFTPAGVAVLEAKLQHHSEVLEAGVKRRLQFDFSAIALGSNARELAAQPLGSELELSAFLAPRSRRSARLVVHVLGFSRLADRSQAGAKQNDTIGMTEQNDGNSQQKQQQG